MVTDNAFYANEPRAQPDCYLSDCADYDVVHQPVYGGALDGSF